MFCPVCGKQVETPMEFQGAKVCPECGCVMEAPKAAVKVTYEKGAYTPGKALAVRIMSGISIALLVIFFFYYLNNLLKFFNNVLLNEPYSRFLPYDINSGIQIILMIGLCFVMLMKKQKKQSKILIMTFIILLSCSSFIEMYLTNEIMTYHNSGLSLFQAIGILMAISPYVFLAIHMVIKKKGWNLPIIIVPLLLFLFDLINFGRFDAFAILYVLDWFLPHPYLLSQVYLYSLYPLSLLFKLLINFLIITALYIWTTSKPIETAKEEN